MGAVFDLSFSNFISSTLVKFLYTIALIIIAIATIGILISGLTMGGAKGYAMALLGAPLFFILSVLWARVFSELTIILFRIFETLQEISDGGSALGGESSEGSSSSDF